jgi:hypothetical protein
MSGSGPASQRIRTPGPFGSARTPVGVAGARLSLT